MSEVNRELQMRRDEHNALSAVEGADLAEIRSNASSKMIADCTSLESIMGAYEVMKLPRLNQTHSFLCTRFKRVGGIQDHLSMLSRSTEEKERAAIINDWITHEFAEMSPFYESLCLQTRKFYRAASNFMNGSVEAGRLKEGLRLFKSRDADCSWKKTSELIKIYRTMCGQFRELLEKHKLVPDSFKTVTGQLEREFPVPGNLLQTLKEMLLIMKSQNQERGYVGTGCSHYALFKPFLTDPGLFTEPPNLTSRRKTVQPTMQSFEMPIGAETSKLHETLPVASTVNKGVLLLSTAIVKGIQSEDFTVEEVLGTLGAYAADLTQKYGRGEISEEAYIAKYSAIMCACSEVEGSPEWKTGENAGAYSQAANIDVVASTCFWLFCVAEIPDYESYMTCLGQLHLVLKSGAGKEKTITLLRARHERSIDNLLANLSECPSIHLPPFVPNIRRLKDSVAAFASAHINISLSFLRPLGSPKFILHMKDVHAVRLDTICRLFDLEQFMFRDNEPDEKIYQSLILLHQVIIRKPNIFSNTHRVVGNALDVKLIPTN